MLEKQATYWYILPTYRQAKKAIWSAVDPHTGMKRINGVIPKALIESVNNTEMSLSLVNGSTLQFVGAKNMEDLRGAPPYGIVVSEYAKCPQTLFSEILSPILDENNGWIVFNTTPSGKNHAYDLWESMKGDSSCFTSKITVHDSGIFDKEKIDDIYKKHISIDEEYGRSVFSQEFLCSFESPRSGSYYGGLIEKARNEGRIFDMKEVQFFRNIIDSPMHEMLVAADLGVDDSTALWFFKRYQEKIFVCGYHEARRQGAQYYASYIKENFPQVRRIVVPHDARVQEWGTGKTRIESLIELGLRPIVCPSLSLADGIFAVRETFPNIFFDESKTLRGIEALSWYHQEYKENVGAFSQRPKHDWSSHAADGFRYACIWCKKVKDNDDPIQSPVFSSPHLNNFNKTIFRSA